MKPLSLSIIGCGWLGKPLYASLLENNTLHCYTRREEEESLENYYFKPDTNSAFWACDYLIIAISTKDDYLNTLKHIALHVKKETVIIMMSNISIYREFDAEVDEASVITQSEKQYKAEVLLQREHKNTIILRLGGLMGEDRIAGRWSKVSKFTDGYVNYVYRDDVINIVNLLVTSNITRGIYNVVAPKHPLRSQVHAHNAKIFGFHVGKFEGMSRRKVSSKKLIEAFRYTFVYPDPIEFW